jgi:hypothetical protein
MNSHLAKAGMLAALCLAANVASADNDFGFGVKAGTLGLGVEATWRPLPYMDLRLGMNQFHYSDDGSQGGINYDAELNLDNAYLTGNFRFPLSPFRLTAGVFSNGNEINLISGDNGAIIVVGGDPYPADAVGTLRSTASFASTSPYVGVGYDFSLFGKVGMNLDFGVLWQGEPNVSLSADGLLSGDPTFQASLEAERLELVDEVSDFKAWPVVSLGFVVNFL